jgi:predicted alpha/beta-fold hydrolase
MAFMETTDFDPAFILANRHLQSMLGSRLLRAQLVRRRWQALSPPVEDVIVECDDGVRLLGHYTPASGTSPKALAVLIHGWEGSADSTYLLSSTMALLAAGYAVFRLNLRDHGSSHHLNEELFHSCRLPEVLQAVEWVRRRYSPDIFTLAGFSLGGNFALRVAAAPERQVDIDQVVAVCPVLDPATTMRALDSGWVVYRQFFIRKWRDSLAKKMLHFPARYKFRDLKKFTRLESMTDHFVRNYTEYDDLAAYLKGYALTGERLAGLAIPSTILLADDDPVIPIHDIDELHVSPSLRIIRSPHGGHCGFIESFQPQSWLDQFIVAQMPAVNPAIQKST